MSATAWRRMDAWATSPSTGEMDYRRRYRRRVPTSAPAAAVSTCGWLTAARVDTGADPGMAVAEPVLAPVPDWYRMLPPLRDPALDEPVAPDPEESR